jgi:hypothetical protein
MLGRLPVISLYSTPVLATCHIRPQNEALRTPSHVSRTLSIPEIESRISVHSPIHLQTKKESYTVHSLLIFIKQMTSMCLQSLQHRFVDRTKPSTTFLILGTVADLARSKSELVAENALLRQQLLILRRHVKRPACTKTDRLLLVLLARMVRTWKQVHITRSARYAPAVASSGISAVLEVQVQGSFYQTKDIPRDRGLDQGDGKGQSTVGGAPMGYGG